MSQIEDLWRRLEETGPGGATRVDESHPSDLYGATDGAGHRGLVLFNSNEPPKPPTLDAIEVTTHQRHDGRWALGIWLLEPDLMPVFAQLCTDLIATSRQVDPSVAAGHLLARIVRWRELLEDGAGPMSMSKLRGLVGEMLVLELCADHWSAADVVSGWVGPLGGAQDFVLPDRMIEVKTTYASARSVHISSVDQLDTDEPLFLAVVTLTTLVGGAGIAPNELVSRIESRLLAVDADLAIAFRQRLDGVGYLPVPRYDTPMFRLDRLDFYEVGNSFPRIRRAEVGTGIESVVYDVMIGAFSAHRAALRR